MVTSTIYIWGFPLGPMFPYLLLAPPPQNIVSLSNFIQVVILFSKIIIHLLQLRTCHSTDFLCLLALTLTASQL
jgi:hypothetical protein